MFSVEVCILTDLEFRLFCCSSKLLWILRLFLFDCFVVCGFRFDLQMIYIVCGWIVCVVFWFCLFGCQCCRVFFWWLDYLGTCLLFCFTFALLGLLFCCLIQLLVWCFGVVLLVSFVFACWFVCLCQAMIYLSVCVWFWFCLMFCGLVVELSTFRGLLIDLYFCYFIVVFCCGIVLHLCLL